MRETHSYIIFKTGFDVLCAQNRHLVLTILNGCNKIEDVRARLNCKKGQFDKEEVLEIWEQCFKHITKEVFPNDEEDNTDSMDHVWTMGIILVYILCGYPALKETEDIQCYNNLAKAWCNLTPEARKGNHSCPTMLWSNEWRRKTKEEIIEKNRLQWDGYSMDDTGFYSTDKKIPVMGNEYKEYMDEAQREDLNPFLYHFGTGYDCLCDRNEHFVLTILDRCKLTNIVRTTLNSRKGRLKEAEAATVWINALDYVHYKLFLNHDKGNTYETNHIWGLGIILCYLLWCGYPALNRKAEYTVMTQLPSDQKQT
eukprot:jgi/Psemu1/26823/gm1.26823_g